MQANREDLLATEELEQQSEQQKPQSPYHHPHYHLQVAKKHVKEIVKSEKRKMDEYDIYGKYIASELRALQNDTAVTQAKSYISNILIGMRMGKYNYGYVYHSHPGYDTASKPASLTSQKELETIEEIRFTNRRRNR